MNHNRQSHQNTHTEAQHGINAIKPKPIHSQGVGAYAVKPPRKVSLSELMRDQKQALGFEPLPLNVERLLQRITQGGHSGQFLADAFISAYRTDTPFTHSLGELTKLDTEGFRLFHAVLHIRHVKGWNDNDLYDIEQKIKTILGSR